LLYPDDPVPLANLGLQHFSGTDRTAHPAASAVKDGREHQFAATRRSL